MASDREIIDALLSALDRTEGNFRSAVNGWPVRDMAENLAENAHARKLAAGRRCERCNHALDEYEPGLVLCGACEDEDA